jgi:hypothetical protein
VAAGELGDHQRPTACVDPEIAVDRRGRHGCQSSPDPVRAHRSECVGDPSTGVVHEDLHWADLALGALEQVRDHRGVQQIRFDRDRPVRQAFDRREHVPGARSPSASTLVRRARIERIINTQIRDHHVDAGTRQRLACDLPGGTPDLIVASTYNRDDGESGTSAAAFIDPATNRLLATVELPVDVSIGIVLDNAVFFAAEGGTRAVVVDRATWSVSAVPELWRATGDLGTIEADGTSIYIPTLDQRDVLVVDATRFTVTATVAPLGVHSVTILDRSLWVSSYDFTVQRFDLAG